MFKNSVQASENSKCLDSDDVNQSCIMSFTRVGIASILEKCDDIEDIEKTRCILENSSCSYYKENILYYISDLIVNKNMF